jgi:anti-sigma regulatory factor (Ser/Thr protein kinase)
VLLHELAEDARLSDDVTLLVVRVDDPGPLLRRQYPARLDMLRVIRAETRDWLTANGVAPEDQGDLLVAIGEASSNAIEHGAGVRAQQHMGYRLEITPNLVTATVTDTGTWIDRQRRGVRGHGLGIMRAMVDDLEITTGEHGTTVTLRRYRRR